MLSELEVLGLGRNNFSSPLPFELSNLTKLTKLGIGTNNFNGPLSPELGNLTKLLTLMQKVKTSAGFSLSFNTNQILNIYSFGVSGEIPSSFANLKNLVLLRAFDIELTGRIPDFIGNWSNMKDL
ncbi:hypothetical protein Patl1_21269 [Pistacia atlantica]|uniref:Uncharacterized protein n=1 Tax=Pistacia atlantica TaxID=434234 RepID=A0ACC1BJA5_9ROSI|nr:hypothetical protein Patl1_21269 [Pistacia atlantica]